tara:strand:+ start:1131 stop:1598 length:468 start_codon:yes stop_codon:yes gene_type:complete
MSYIGSGPLYGNYPSQLLDSSSSPTPVNGSNYQFPLTHAPASAAGIIVCIDGVKQSAADGAYGVSGTTLDFGSALNAPAASTKIEIVYLGIQANSVVIDQTLGASDTDQAAIIRLNHNEIDTPLTIISTDNGVSAGPITISGSTVVTVNGSWSIV